MTADSIKHNFYLLPGQTLTPARCWLPLAVSCGLSSLRSEQGRAKWSPRVTPLTGPSPHFDTVSHLLKEKWPVNRLGSIGPWARATKCHLLLAGAISPNQADDTRRLVLPKHCFKTPVSCRVCSFLISLHCVLSGGPRALRGAAKVPGEGWVGMGAPWFAGDSKDLAGVSSCTKKKKLTQSLLGMAQYHVHKRLWWDYHEGQSCPVWQIWVGATQMSSAANVQCWAGGAVPVTVTDLVIGRDSPHLSKKSGCRACQGQGMQSATPALWCGVPNPIMPAIAGERGSLSKLLWLS